MTNDTSDPAAGADDDLVERARVDAADLGCLFDRYYPRVLAYCLRRLNDRASAEDVTSDVFLRVATHLGGFAGHGEIDFRRWLFRVATNGVLAELRKTGRRQQLLEAAARDGRFDRDARDRHEASDWPVIHAAVMELDEREQTIVTLRFFADLSHEEIAGIVDSTPGAVRTSLSRTLARLRERFDPSRHAPGGT